MWVGRDEELLYLVTGSDLAARCPQGVIVKYGDEAINFPVQNMNQRKFSQKGCLLLSDSQSNIKHRKT